MLAKSIDDIKKKRGRPRVDTKPILTRFHMDLIGRIDDFRRNETDLPGRPEAIRRLVEKALKRK